MCGHAFDNVGSFIKDIGAPVAEVAAGVIAPEIIPYELAGAAAGGIATGSLGGAVEGAGIGAGLAGGAEALGANIDVAGLAGSTSGVTDALGLTSAAGDAAGLTPLGDASSVLGASGTPLSTAPIASLSTPSGIGALTPSAGGAASAATSAGAGAIPGVSPVDLTAVNSAGSSLDANLASGLTNPATAGGAGGGTTLTASQAPGIGTRALTSLGVGPETASAITGNAGTVLSGLGLLKSVATPAATSGVSNLQQEAASLQNQGNTLQSYLTSGTLPPGVQTSIDSATKAAQAAVRSKYAALGMSGSTAEIADLNSVTQTAAMQGTQIATNLLNAGINETQLSSELYQNLINISGKQSEATGAAISNFATALSGGNNSGKSVNIYTNGATPGTG